MHHKKYILGTVALLLSTAVNAQTPFDEAVDRLTAADLGAQSQYNATLSEAAAIRTEVTPEDPEVEFEYLWPNAKGESNRWSAGVSQQLPDFRRMHAAKSLSGAIKAAANLQLEVARRESRLKVTTLLIDYVSAKKKLSLIQGIHANFDNLIDAYGKAYNRGEVTVIDLNKIRIEHARAHAANASAQAEADALAQQLLALCPELTASDLKGIEEYPVSVMPACDIDSLITHSPQSRLLAAQNEVSQRRISLASKERFPQLSLGYRHAYEDGMHFNGFSAALTLPVFSRKSAVDEARYNAVATALAADRDTKGMYADARSAKIKADALKLNLEQLSIAVGQTNNLLLLRKALDLGQISLLDYLLECNYFAEASEEYIETAREYATAVATLRQYE